MYRIYLAGPVGDSYRWREDIKESNNMNVIEFEDPTGVEATGNILVEENLSQLTESDAVLLRLMDGVPERSAAMTMVYSQARDMPVIIWHDGQELTEWETYHANGEAESGKEALYKIMEAL